MLAKYTTTTRNSAEDHKQGIVAREYLLPVGLGLRIKANRVSELGEQGINASRIGLWLRFLRRLL